MRARKAPTRVVIFSPVKGPCLRCSGAVNFLRLSPTWGSVRHRGESSARRCS